MAARDPWITVEGQCRLSRWRFCATCRQPYTGVLEVELDRRLWRRHRDAPTSVEKFRAQTILASALTFLDEFDAAERLHEESRREVPDGDPLYNKIVLASDLDWAGVLTNVGRDRDALEVLRRIRPRAELREDARARLAFTDVECTALGKLGRVQEAWPLAADAVEVARSSYGPQSPEMLEAMCLQAKLFASIGRFEEAKATLQHVLAAQTRLLGPSHVRTCSTQEVLRYVETCSTQEVLRYVEDTRRTQDVPRHVASRTA
mmetsp:Transcript_22749/g.90233  ORF Transcript_22749/g.90233 Transcript_22749/m.90233 type:complete len:261 (+) Transcript_22749:1-783(+)